jgi:hypothetical protein
MKKAEKSGVRIILHPLSFILALLILHPWRAYLGLLVGTGGVFGNDLQKLPPIL